MRKSQRTRILELLVENANEWVSLKKIMGLKIANHTARLTEIKKEWFVIENKTEWKKNWYFGSPQKHSYYRLVI